MWSSSSSSNYSFEFLTAFSSSSTVTKRCSTSAVSSTWDCSIWFTFSFLLITELFVEATERRGFVNDSVEGSFLTASSFFSSSSTSSSSWTSAVFLSYSTWIFSVTNFLNLAISSYMYSTVSLFFSICAKVARLLIVSI